MITILSQVYSDNCLILQNSYEINVLPSNFQNIIKKYYTFNSQLFYKYLKKIRRITREFFVQIAITNITIRQHFQKNNLFHTSCIKRAVSHLKN